MSLKKLTSNFWAILAVVSLSLLNISCSDTETTDSTNFVIYYTGMTDIGPSMEGTISQPTYKGSTPSDFAITGMTLNGEPYAGDCFVVDSETGEISIQNTRNASTGRYSISISCVSGGKTYNFQDIVVVKLLAAAPEGITVTPNFLKADYGDVIDINSIIDMPTAKVVTEGEHISITSYAIGAVEKVITEAGSSEPHYLPLGEEFKQCFTISEGVISITQGEASKRLEPATYSVSLILGTKVSETMLERAINIEITSKPLDFSYSPNYGKIEAQTTDEPTTFKSVLPILKGSAEGLKYSIYNPTTDKIKIDENTGRIYVEGGHGFHIGEKYTISICARNIYNTEEEEGKIIENAYTLEVVDFIHEITQFSYYKSGETFIEKVEAARYILQPETDGDEILYEFLNLPTELKNELTLGLDGTISVKKGNKIPKDTYTFSVVATNPKGSMTAEVKLKIVDNPNKFTYIRYGNNLNSGNQLEGIVYENQFRFYASDKNNLPNLKFTPKTDIAEGIPTQWDAVKIHQAGIAGGIKADGTITFNSWKEANCGIVLVTATTGDDPDTQYSVSVPVFVQFSTAVAGYTIEYTPLVLHVNPKYGGSSNTPLIKLNDIALTADEQSKLLVDYRRTFNYYNNGGKRIDGTFHENGQPLDNLATQSKFMKKLWNDCDGGDGTKVPMSYFQAGTITPKGNWDKTLGYVDNGTDLNKRHSVNIIGGQWNDQGWANGFMVGQMTFTAKQTVTDLNNGNQIFPFIIWFDEYYEK